MKLYINRNPVSGPWGGGAKFFNAFWEFSSVELMKSQTMNINPDVMLLVGLDNQGPTQISAEQAVMYKMYVNPGCKLVLRVNECDARKGTTGVDDGLIKLSRFVDGTVFVSRWLQEYFNAKGWGCQNQTVIYNGVQRSIFKPQPKVDNGKLNIVAHHWSDNRMKGADIYERLDELAGKNPDKLAFTYVGRHQCDFKHTNVIKPLHGQALGDELGKHDVYVSASRFDPGPNHILEALACGLPTYVHKDGGGCVEFAGTDHVYGDMLELESIITAVGLHASNTNFTLSSWKDCVTEYNAFLEATWKAQTTSA